MSVDLCFWKSPAPDDEAERYRIYGALTDGNWRAAEPAPEVVAFRQALVARHGDWEDGVMEPLRDQEGLDRYLLLTLPFGVAEAEVEEVAALAHAGGLVMFDPQMYDGDDWAEDEEEPRTEPPAHVLDAARDAWFVGILQKHGRRVEPPNSGG